jgi:hypothetical protein
MEIVISVEGEIEVSSRKDANMARGKKVTLLPPFFAFSPYTEEEKEGCEWQRGMRR